jgi:hypothetical protein
LPFFDKRSSRFRDWTVYPAWIAQLRPAGRYGEVKVKKQQKDWFYGCTAVAELADALDSKSSHPF